MILNIWPMPDWLYFVGALATLSLYYSADRAGKYPSHGMPIWSAITTVIAIWLWPLVAVVAFIVWKLKK